MPPVGSRVRSPGRGSGGLELCRQWDLGSDRLVEGQGVCSYAASGIQGQITWSRVRGFGAMPSVGPGSDRLVEGQVVWSYAVSGIQGQIAWSRVGVWSYAASGIHGQITWSRVRGFAAMPSVGSRVRSPGRGSGVCSCTASGIQGQITWSRVRGFGAMPPVGSRVRSPDRGSGGLELYRQWDLGSDRLVRGLGVPGLCAERDPGSDHLVRGSEGPGTMLPAGSRVRSSGQRVRGVSGYAPSGIQG